MLLTLLAVPCNTQPTATEGTLIPATVPTGGYATGDVVTITCNTGFGTSTPTATCQADGAFNNPSLVCGKLLF